MNIKMFTESIRVQKDIQNLEDNYYKTKCLQEDHPLQSMNNFFMKLDQKIVIQDNQLQTSTFLDKHYFMLNLYL